jgi:diacylglycerol kinase
VRASAFRYAGRGIWLLVAGEANTRIHLPLWALAFWAVWVERLGVMALLAVIGLGVLVLALEAANSAIERAVDLAAPEVHPLAAEAKDLAAGAVLLAAIGALAVAFLLFWPGRALLLAAVPTLRGIPLLVPVALFLVPLRAREAGPRR